MLLSKPASLTPRPRNGERNRCSPSDTMFPMAPEQAWPRGEEDLGRASVHPVPRSARLAVAGQGSRRRPHGPARSEGTEEAATRRQGGAVVPPPPGK